MGLFGFIWHFRTEIIIAAQFVAALRKTAREVTREYIKRKLRERLTEQVGIILFEVALLAGAWYLCAHYPGVWSRCLASLILWAVTLYNLLELTFRTIPELRDMRRLLKSKTGYAVKYLLQISLVTELLQLNMVFLLVCILLGVSTRTYVASHFSYVSPWKEIAVAPKRALKNFP